MSMKIYNAYRLKGDYDLISLNEFCDNLRKEVTKISEQMALDWVANKTLYYYNFKKLHGSQVVQDMIKETKNSKEMHETWKLADVDRWDSLYWNISDMAFGRNLQNQRKREIIQIFPLQDKILVMFFGSKDIQNYLENTGHFDDYHYQNQCEKPDAISEEEWNRRCIDWRKAIGPDYVPCKHGFCVELFDINNVFPKFVISDETIHIKNEEDQTKELIKTLSMSNVKGYPTNEKSFNEWFRFKESEEYKEWIKDAKKLIHSKCDFITTKEEFIDLLTDLHTNRWQIS